jgi:hypothetical protein
LEGRNVSPESVGKIKPGNIGPPRNRSATRPGVSFIAMSQPGSL